MDFRRSAAANNAEWCDLVCRSHGVETHRDAQAWSARSRAPRLYPDAVTLTPEASAADLLRRVDASVGCSIKDSFAVMDLSAHGFRILFEAQWIRAAPIPQVPIPLVPIPPELRGEVVRDRAGFTAWEQSWPDGDGEPGPLRSELVDHDAVTVLAGRIGDEVVAGAILHRSGPVVGISNVFAPAERAEPWWATCASFAATLAPGAVLCGYETGSALAVARRGGFEAIGPVRVWIRGDELTG